MRRAVALALALACLPLHAQEGQPLDQLDIAAPPGWDGGWKTGVDNKGPDWRYWVFLPAKAEEGSLARMLSIANTWGPKQSSARLIQQWTDHIKNTCPDMSMVSSDVLRANGYTVGYARFYCPKRSDTGEGSVDFVKTISSDKSSYMIALAQRTAPYISSKPGHIVYAKQADADALTAWLKSAGDYLQKNVRACNTPSPTPPVVLVCSN